MSAIVRVGDIANSFEDMQRVAKMLAISGYFSAQGADAIAIAKIATQILAGREMGYGPFASVQGIHIIQGKPAIAANLMASAVKNSPRYDYRVKEITDKVCRIEFFEFMDGKRESLGVSEFTLEQAKQANVKNLDKFPRNMLFARAISNGVRWFCPDVFSGNTVYVPEELGVDVDGDGNPVVDVTPRVLLDSAPAVSQDGPEGNPFDDAAPEPEPMVDDATQKRLHALGTAVYGAEWDGKRHEIIGALTKGRTHSSKDLTLAEAKRLIAGMVALQAKMQQPDAKARKAQAVAA